MNQQVAAASIAITREHKQITKQNIVLWIDHLDKPHVAKLSAMFASANLRVYDGNDVSGLPVLAAQCKQAGFKTIVTTRLDVLLALLPPGRVKKANISNYTGSIIPYNGIEFLIIPALKQLVTIEYAPWMFKHILRKVTHPDEWRKTSEFRWWLIKPGSEFVNALKVLAGCDLIAVDTETQKPNANCKWPRIELVQYTGFKFETNESWTYVLTMDSMDAVQFMRSANSLDVPKVLQNGKYDCAYFFMYNAPLIAYYHDLKNGMHSQYCELPKDLAFSSALWLRDIMYWKDLSSSGDSQDKFRYGALDTWATGEAYISWLSQAPDWAKQNYITEFSLVPSLHMVEMRGIKRDMPKLYEVAEIMKKDLEKLLVSCQTMVGTTKFNPSSPDQCVRLICALTGTKPPDKSVKVKDMTEQEKRARQASDKKAMEKASYAHPLNERVLTAILDYRQMRKELGTYLAVGAATKSSAKVKKGDSLGKEFGPEGKERILYSLSPDATDSGRLASKEHHFWCGINIQNMKSGGQAKSTYIADEGFELFEADFSQAEDRGVAYSSGDPTLLDIFDRGVDSHSYKAAMFFGIPYENIYREPTPEYIDGVTGLLVPAVEGKVLLKPIRQLGKRINHGANYNMGEQVLLETMGPKAVREAQKVLKLPSKLTLIQVCKYLLECYARAFPTVKKEYYKSIVLEIKRTNKMVSDTGWVRYCFGNPETSKPALNKYVAHKTQNLNAMNLNRAWLAVNRKHMFNPNLRLLAQIHDSILGQTRIGHRYLVQEVKELMTFPVPIRDCAGITRDLIVPVDIKILGRTWAGTDE